jgi:hypothetical protein
MEEKKVSVVMTTYTATVGVHLHGHYPLYTLFSEICLLIPTLFFIFVRKEQL